MKRLGMIPAMAGSVLSLAFISAAGAQAARPGPIVSPEILPDHRVTFRLNAPFAKDVSISGEFLAAAQPMTKDTNGVWSITLGPMQAGPDIYSFTVDGLAIADPINPHMKIRASTSGSYVDVPGDGPQLWDPQDVPHGNIQINPEKSVVIGDTRTYYVYTPPGYDQDNTTKYPVLYLLHGNNDTQAGWTDIGHAHFIMDNLLAQKKIVPMIVVMPFGHATPYGARGGANNNEVFENYLLKDVIPDVEKKYRVLTDRDHRAITGLSMGGGQTLQIGWDHLELFSYISAFSFVVPQGFETKYAAELADPAINDKLNLMWMGVGSQDNMMYNNDHTFAAMLDKHKIVSSMHETPGRHQYAVWRELLVESAPLLFKGKPAAAPAAAK